MKTLLKIISIPVFALGLIFSSFILINSTGLKKHFVPVVEQLGDLNVIIENDTCYVSSKLTARNRSFLKLEIDSINYMVSFLNKTYLHNQQYVGMVLPSHASDTIDFSLKIPHKSIMKDLRSELKKNDSTSYGVYVSLLYSTFLGRSEMPISRSARLKIPQPPEIEIVKVNYKKVRMKYIQAEVIVKITNHNPIDLSVKEMSYAMDVDKQGSIKGAHSEPINIKPKATTLITLPIRITPKNMAKTLFQILFDKDEYEYTLRLKALLESTYPENRSITLNLTNKGKMELKK